MRKGGGGGGGESLINDVKRKRTPLLLLLLLLGFGASVRSPPSHGSCCKAEGNGGGVTAHIIHSQSILRIGRRGCARKRRVHAAAMWRNGAASATGGEDGGVEGSCNLRGGGVRGEVIFQGRS